VPTDHIDMPTELKSIRDEAHLDDLLSEPTDGVVRAMRTLEGDIIVLGVAGKMGPTLARMAKRASDAAGVKRRVIGVSRFSSPELEQRLAGWGVETIRSELLDRDALAALPDAPNVVYMAGMKFGSTGQEWRTWAMNVYLPGLVAERYRSSRIAVFSTGNVYGLCSVSSGGSREGDELNPTGEYAMSCLGRERIFEHFSRVDGTKMTILRLNYACEMRYGVLVDIAQKVYSGRPVSLSMGYLNTIWQRDASAMSLESLAHVATPPNVLNITGADILSVRKLAGEFGVRMGKTPTFEGKEATDALLNNSNKAFALFGKPPVSVSQMLDWIADWVARGGASLAKPTHFEERAGRF
jgi:nucleoside-diphosphate-sugar epimerase